MNAISTLKAVTVLTILLVLPTGLAVDQAAEKAARAAAESWLALIDSGQYAKSQHEASFLSKQGRQREMDRHGPIGVFSFRQAQEADLCRGEVYDRIAGGA